jgi:hypothetical protein
MKVNGCVHARLLYTLRKRPLYLLDRRLGEPQSRFGRCGVQKVLPLLGIEPQISPLCNK